ncbi:hypothetical protein ACFL0V_01085 [Nanoarchaeota archaeon]
MPKSWIVENKVCKGDELELTPKGNHLIVSTDKPAEKSEISIDVTGLDRTSILLHIRSAYRKGHDTIELKYSEPYTKHLRTNEKKKVSSIIHNEVSRLVGVEVIQQKENSCIIKSISQSSPDDFTSIIRRIFILVNDLAKDVDKGYKDSNFAILDTVMEKHDTITKFISYCLRLLNKTNNGTIKNRIDLYYTISALENIIDVLKWGGRRSMKLEGKKFDKRTSEIITKIMNSVSIYYDMFYKFDKLKVGKMYQNRHEAFLLMQNHLTKLPIEQAIIVNEQAQVLNHIVSLTERKLIDF